MRLREGAWEPWSLRHAFLDCGRALPRAHLERIDWMTEWARKTLSRRWTQAFLEAPPPPRVGPRTLSQQWGPHPSHHLRMLRGACTVLGVSGLEWSEASRRAVETSDHPYCRAAAGGAVRCITALLGSVGNSSALERVLSSLTGSPWPCEGHPLGLGKLLGRGWCGGVGRYQGL